MQSSLDMSARDPLLSKPLLLQRSLRFSVAENEGGEVWNNNDQSYDEDGVPLSREITSEIVDGGMTFSGETSDLTSSRDNLPVSFPVSVGNVFGNGSGRVYADDAVVLPVTVSQVTPFSSDITNPNSQEVDLHTEQEEKRELPPLCEHIAYLVHQAVFGILGVLTRYLLQKLFGPSVIGVTSDGSILYVDLPSNMVGSFLMGWLGIIFKSDISRVSDQLAIGLSTGYLGSLTTFSGWNQKMLELSVNGHWDIAVIGFVVGWFLHAASLSFGVETAEGFRWLLRRNDIDLGIMNWRVNKYKCNLAIHLVLVLMWAGLWTTSGILEKKEFKDSGSGAQLWLACFVGPLGVWIRWWLSRLNGRGLGKAGLWKWIPFGTLTANVSAACVMAALATLKLAVNTKDCDTIATGIQFGLMGCLSTVSTLMAEFYVLRNSSHPWRAYAYVGMTIGISFSLGTLIYSVPVWTKGYS